MRANQVILLPSILGKVVEKIPTDFIVKKTKMENILDNEKIGGNKINAATDAVVVLIYKIHKT